MSADWRDDAGIPRRNCLDKLTLTETLIHNAEVAVESLTADVRLTHAGIKLQEARALVADFVDGVPFGEGYPRPSASLDVKLDAQRDGALEAAALLAERVPVSDRNPALVRNEIVDKIRALKGAPSESNSTETKEK